VKPKRDTVVGSSIMGVAGGLLFLAGFKLVAACVVAESERVVKEEAW